MRLRTNWQAAWTPWVTYTHHDTRTEYQSRKRELFCGRMRIATLVQSTLRKQPFYMLNDQPKLLVRGSTVFRTVRAFMRQLR